jgi:hypothetical protein
MRHLILALTVAATLGLAACATTHPNLSAEDSRIVDSIHSKVKKNWYAMPYLDSDKKSATVDLTLNGDGTIAKLVTTKSSGNVNFDNGLNVAIYQAAPFEMPKPPRTGLTTLNLTFTK